MKLSISEKEDLINLITILQHELDRRNGAEKKLQKSLEKFRKHDRVLRNRINQLQSKIVDFLE